MSEILLSIVIPSYNSGGYIERCIDSIFKAGESYLDEFEVIIINDGSTDNTYEVCSFLMEKYNNLILINGVNAGVSSARNTGIFNARGLYVAFCDSDDKVNDCYFSSVIPNLKSCEIDILSFGYYTYYETNNIMKLNVLDQKRFSNEMYIQKMFSSDAIGGFVWNKILKKQIIGDLLFNKQLEICEDLEFIFRVLNQKKELNIEYIPLGLYIYYNNTLSASRRLKNLFEKNGTFKYSNTINYMLRHGGSNYEILLKSKIFDCALSVMLNNVISKELNDKHLITLRKELRSNLVYFFKNRNTSLKEKLKLTTFYIFPELKRITNKS